MYLSSMMFLSDVENIQASEVYHCYQLIYTFGDKINQRKVYSHLSILLSEIQKKIQNGEIENMNLTNFLQVITSAF